MKSRLSILLRLHFPTSTSTSVLIVFSLNTKTDKMKFSLATLVFGLVAISSATPQNQNRPVPNGQCCVANTSLKQDTCNVNGQRGRCVPGGNNCGSRLSCVAQSNLQCNNVIERGRNLCRARAPGGGLFDGARIIQNLGQASVN